MRRTAGDARRRRSRRKRTFGRDELARVEALLKEKWAESRCRIQRRQRVVISHETFTEKFWRD